LALVAALVRDLFLAARLLSVAAMSVAMAFWFALLRARAGARVGLFTLLFLAANPTFLRYGYSATTDGVALALQALALWLLLARPGLRAVVIAGALSACAFLTRYNAVYLLPLGLVTIALRGARQETRGRAALGFAAGFTALVAPWIVFSLARGGTFQFQLHHNIAYDVFARAKGIPWDDYQKLLQPQFKTLWDVIERDPKAVFRRELFNLGDHLVQDAKILLGLPVSYAALAGIAFAAWDGTLRRLWPLWLAWAMGFVLLVPIFYSERYSLTLLPVYACLAATAFASPKLALVLTRMQGVWIKALCMAIPLVLSIQTSAKLQEHVHNQLPVEVLDVAQRLRALKAPGDRVMARKPHIAFHADLESVPFPFTRTIPELGAYTREKHVRWIYFSFPEAEMRPAYWYMLDTTAVIPGLVPRYVSRGHPAVLYEVMPGFGVAPPWMSNDTLMAYHVARARLMVNPNLVQALYTLGYIERSRMNAGAARRYLERAARLEPSNLNVALLLGEAYLMLGDGESARMIYERVQQLEPGSVPAQVGRGWAALMTRHPDEAAALWRPVVTQTRDRETLESMIQLFRTRGDRVAEEQARAALARELVSPPGGAR
jgi:hypothetical protein